jgi:arylsulfatase A-like enzyme
MLDHSIVIVTSDHGEMFERGVSGHTTPLIFDPLVRVPLIISVPGGNRREDVFENTSSVDILPTIAHLTGNPIPDWGEGTLLTGLGGTPDPNRSLFVLDAKENSTFEPLQRFSVSMTRDRYRLTHYHQPSYQAFEFYDLDDDPGELSDLYPSQPGIARSMQEELMDKLREVNRPFETWKD